MLIKYGFQTTISVPKPTPMIAMLEVHSERSGDIQSETPFLTTPQVPTTVYIDRFGNRCRRLLAPAGDVTFQLEGTLFDTGDRERVVPHAAEVPVEKLPPNVLEFLVGSRYCETDRMSQTAWDLFGNVAAGWPRVQAIADYVHDHLAFGYEHARATRTAFEAHEEGIGVCRDFAHLMITFCRCLNIPARYVNGYLGDIGVPPDPAPMNYSAWVEAFLANRWYAFDARHNEPRIGRIVVARGRDAADVPLINSFGQHTLKAFAVVTEEVEEPMAVAAGI